MNVGTAEKFVLDGRTGLKITTSWGTFLYLTPDEVKALCEALPDLFPEHFPEHAALEVVGSTSEDAGL